MGNNKRNFSKIAGAFVGLLFSFPADAIDQTAAQEEAKAIHDDGSDKSLKHSYKNALHAVDNFFQLNIPGAITYGVKAYGQYKNSEKLDDLRDKNQLLAGTMNSVSSAEIIGDSSTGPRAKLGPQTERASTGQTNGASPFVRIDPSFLREGETAAIAEKIEKLTGMPREKLFKAVTDIQTRNIQRSMTDSDFISAAKKEYRDLVKKVPNQEFKATLAKAEDLLSVVPVQSMIAKATDFAAAASSVMVAMQPSAAPAEVAPATAEAAAAGAPAVTVITEAPQGMSTADQAAAAEKAADPKAHLLGLERLQFDPVEGYLGDLLKTSPRGEDPDSIFRTVSAKIRDMNVRQNMERRMVPASQKLALE